MLSAMVGAGIKGGYLVDQMLAGGKARRAKVIARHCQSAEACGTPAVTARGGMRSLGLSTIGDHGVTSRTG